MEKDTENKTIGRKIIENSGIKGAISLDFGTAFSF